VLNYILDLIACLGHWSYLLVFLAAALECAAFLGLVVPGESVMLASGFFAQLGLLKLDAVILVGILGAVVGDNIGPLVPFVAGASRMPYRQFLAYNALGAVLWTCVLLGSS
jgi:membrane protein DedA with SNARE-associated domain